MYKIVLAVAASYSVAASLKLFVYECLYNGLIHLCISNYYYHFTSVIAVATTEQLGLLQNCLFILAIH